MQSTQPLNLFASSGLVETCSRQSTLKAKLGLSVITRNHNLCIALPEPSCFFNYSERQEFQKQLLVGQATNASVYVIKGNISTTLLSCPQKTHLKEKLQTREKNKGVSKTCMCARAYQTAEGTVACTNYCLKLFSDWAPSEDTSAAAGCSIKCSTRGVWGEHTQATSAAASSFLPPL